MLWLALHLRQLPLELPGRVDNALALAFAGLTRNAERMGRVLVGPRTARRRRRP